MYSTVNKKKYYLKYIFITALKCTCIPLSLLDKNWAQHPSLSGRTWIPKRHVRLTGSESSALPLLGFINLSSAFSSAEWV